MDKSLIRSEPFLGNTKTIVGDKMADLVLETLGKVYIKFGRSTRLLNDLFTLLDKSTANAEDIRSKIIIVNNEQELKDLEYPGDGYFIYNTLTSVLYLSYQREYVPLVNASDYKGGTFVKKSGDTMSGPLEINTSSSPLVIASKALVNNLNVEFLNGYGSENFAKKRIDEIITGSWTFQNLCTSENNWIFKNNVRLYKDIVSSGSISTPEFASGFAGYGWRLDGNTNTLTIDYLVVRKAMKVFEMVINQISATNGSLWVSNSSKCASAKQPIIVASSGIIYGETDSNNNSIKVEFDSSSKQFSNLKSGEYYIFEGVSGGVNTVIIPGSNLSAPSKIGTSTRFKEHYYLFYINDSEGLASSGLINSMSDLYNAALSDTNPLSNYVTIYNTGLKDELNVDVEFPAYVNNQLVYIKTYYKYFGAISSTTVNNNYWIIEIDEESYPLFKQGDIVRCQKYSEGNIKYYDALVLTQLTSRKFLMQKATSVFDIYTEISYGDDGSVESMTEEINKTQYEKTSTGDLDDESVLDDPAEKDNMIQIGNIENIDRQNAIYLTSTDDQSPYIDIISGLNRPDYSVIYNTPKYIKYITTDPNTKHKRSYYVSTVSGGVRLGKFQLDQNTNEIIQKVDDNAIGRFTILYGYDYPTSVNSCLIQKENGLDKYEYTKTTRVRLGKLDGIYNSMLGNNQPYGFGLYGENVFLTGEFYLNNGTSMVDIANGYISLGNSIEDLRNTIEAMPKLEDVTEALGAAGLYIDTTNNKVIIYGDQIGILTTKPPEGETPNFTALFQEGKILANYIDLGRLHLSSGVLPEEEDTYTSFECTSWEYNTNGEDNYYSTIKGEDPSELKLRVTPTYSYQTNVEGKILCGYENNEYVNYPFRANATFHIPTITIDGSPDPLEEFEVKFALFDPSISVIRTDLIGTGSPLYSGNWYGYRYVSLTVSYQSGGKTYKVICPHSKKDINNADNNLDSSVIYDQSLIDLDNYYDESIEAGKTSKGSQTSLKKYNFIFTRIKDVEDYTISVETGFLILQQVESSLAWTAMCNGVGILIGNPTIYTSDFPSDFVDGYSMTTYNNMYRMFYDSSLANYYNEVYKNITAGSSALTMSTYVNSDGVLIGSSLDQYVRIARNEFRALYYGTEFVINKDEIKYRIQGGDWINLGLNI